MQPCGLKWPHFSPPTIVPATSSAVRPLCRQTTPQAFAAGPQTPSIISSGRHGDSADRSGTLIAGRYKLIEPIGEGGMGTVWMAQQIEPVKRMVAVKLVKAGMDTKQVLARFEAERQALAIMDHPNIAGCSMRRDGGGAALLRDGTRQRRADHEVLRCEAADAAGSGWHSSFQSARAIQHAHQKGVIHRDIKPATYWWPSTTIVPCRR